MRLHEGLELEEPSIIIRWGLRPSELRRLFENAGAEDRLRFVTDGYYVAPCAALSGLKTQLGFHFRPTSEEGVLAELEFFDNGSRELSASYALYQRHLEQAFGPPSSTRPGLVSSELAFHDWRQGRVHVSHWVMDRFGPEEHVRIVRKNWLTSILT